MLQFVLAESSPEALIGPLGSAGILGFVLWWFMIKAEARLRGVENAYNRTARAILMLVISLNQQPEKAATRREAMKLSREIDDAENKKQEGGEGTEEES